MNRNYIEHLLFITDELLNDLQVNNPRYATAFDIGSNPVISKLASALCRVPFWFAKPQGEYVQFDIKKIEETKQDLIKLKEQSNFTNEDQ